jgi:RIO1 family
MGSAHLLRVKQLGPAAESHWSLPKRSLRPQVRELCNPGAVYQKLMDFMERLARLGLIHCDFNEFNVMVGAWECWKSAWRTVEARVPAPAMTLSLTCSTCSV